jgi:Tol biopolymer transport system component
MISRRNLWLLIAIPIALILLWASRSTQTSPELQPTQYPPLAGALLYLAPASASADLFALDLDSFELVALTENASISAFDISADAAFIIYASASNSSGNALWKLDLATRNSLLLLDCGTNVCDSPKISSDDRYLAYSLQSEQSADPQIWILNLEDEATSLASREGHAAFSPIWSLDGRLTFYNQTSAAYETVLPDSPTRIITQNSIGGPLSWAFDGLSFIAAEAFPASSTILRGTSGEASLQTPDPETQSAVEITVSALLRYSADSQQSLVDYGYDLIEDANPIISPDGNWLAFSRKYLDEIRWTPGRQLWLLDLQNAELFQLSDDPNFQVSSMSWNSDSTRLAFVRANRTAFNQPLEIWVINHDGSAGQLLAVDAFGPEWLP